jgi:hypothetical protein
VVSSELSLSDLTIKDLGRWNLVDMVQKYNRDHSLMMPTSNLMRKLGIYLVQHVDLQRLIDLQNKGDSF